MKLSPDSVATAVAHLLALSAVLIFTCKVNGETPATIVPAVNPHWRPEGCAACHAPTLERLERIQADQIDMACLSCHDGKRASSEPHPIGRSLAGQQVRLPDSWPLNNGLLSCVTCHDVKRACQIDARRPAENPHMLRGDGSSGADFCGQCHVTELHKQFNPHVPSDHANKDQQNNCLFCHTHDLETSAGTRTGEPHLKTTEPTLCAQCHRQHIDFFEPGHIGRSVTAEILKRIVIMDEKLSGPLYVSENSVSLPLGQSKVVCSTCHNPHALGTFPVDSVLNLGAMAFPRTAHSQVSLRLPGRELCSACHGY